MKRIEDAPPEIIANLGRRRSNYYQQLDWIKNHPTEHGKWKVLGSTDAGHVGRLRQSKKRLVEYYKEGDGWKLLTTIDMDGEKSYLLARYEEVEDE